MKAIPIQVFRSRLERLLAEAVVAAEKAAMQVSYEATKAGAFGGSRHYLTVFETTRLSFEDCLKVLLTEISIASSAGNSKLLEAAALRLLHRAAGEFEQVAIPTPDPAFGGKNPMTKNAGAFRVRADSAWQEYRAGLEARRERPTIWTVVRQHSTQALLTVITGLILAGLVYVLGWT